MLGLTTSSSPLAAAKGCDASSRQHHLGKKNPLVGPYGVRGIHLLLVPAALGGCAGEDKLQLTRDKPKFTLFFRSPSNQSVEMLGGNS